MSNAIQSVLVFAGTVESTGPEFVGLRAPAMLTLIEHDSDYECKFVFFADGALPFTVRAPKAKSLSFQGVAKDPRGWDVSFNAQLNGSVVTGTYVQPHDRGTFELEAI
jgi:hypothetical protein